ncbi:hypothetical protein C0J52_07761 [Blattella germanica]|nr:hypothetical protein C0J52_07761 [Blattella germanica]
MGAGGVKFPYTQSCALKHCHPAVECKTGLMDILLRHYHPAVECKTALCTLPSSSWVQDWQMCIFYSGTTNQQLCARPLYVYILLRHYHPAVECKNGTCAYFTQALPSSSCVQDRHYHPAVECKNGTYEDFTQLPSSSCVQDRSMCIFYSGTTIQQLCARPALPYSNKRDMIECKKVLSTYFAQALQSSIKRELIECKKVLHGTAKNIASANRIKRGILPNINKSNGNDQFQISSALMSYYPKLYNDARNSLKASKSSESAVGNHHCPYAHEIAKVGAVSIIMAEATCVAQVCQEILNVPNHRLCSVQEVEVQRVWGANPTRGSAKFISCFHLGQEGIPFLIINRELQTTLPGQCPNAWTMTKMCIYNNIAIPFWSKFTPSCPRKNPEQQLHCPLLQSHGDVLRATVFKFKFIWTSPEKQCIRAIVVVLVVVLMGLVYLVGGLLVVVLRSGLMEGLVGLVARSGLEVGFGTGFPGRGVAESKGFSVLALNGLTRGFEITSLSYKDIFSVLPFAMKSLRKTIESLGFLMNERQLPRVVGQQIATLTGRPFSSCSNWWGHLIPLITLRLKVICELYVRRILGTSYCIRNVCTNETESAKNNAIELHFMLPNAIVAVILPDKRGQVNRNAVVPTSGLNLGYLTQLHSYPRAISLMLQYTNISSSLIGDLKN